MTALDDMIALQRGDDALLIVRAAMQEIQDTFAAILAGSLTDEMVYGAEARSSATDVSLAPGDPVVQSIAITTADKYVRLADATLIVEGRPMIIRNAGANGYAIRDFENAVLLADLAPGETLLYSLIDGADSAGGGTWMLAVIPAETVDRTARDMAVAALIEANAAGVAGPKGPLVLVDSFVADSLDIAASATYDASGDFYTDVTEAGQVAQAAGSAFGDMTSAGGLAAGFDSTTSQAGTASAQKSVSTSAYIGKDWGSGVARTINKYVAYGPNNHAYGGGGTDTFTWRLYGSNAAPANATDGTLLHEATGVLDSGSSQVRTVDSGITASSAYRYHWVTIVDEAGTTEFHIAELQFFQAGGTANPVYQHGGGSDGAGALDDADPADLIAWFLILPIDALSPGADIVGKLSIDGGATWATGTWAKVGDFDDKELWRLEADVSAQSGSLAAFRLEGANSKGWRFKAVGGVLPVY